MSAPIDSQVSETQRAGGRARLASSTLSEQVTHEIVKGILRGDLPARGLLPSEKELARQFEVSRPVVREAVQKVAMLGLIERRQGRGTRIAAESSWRHLAPELLLARTEIGSMDRILLELHDLRRMVEVDAAALAARYATERDVADMDAHLEAMDAHAGDDEVFSRHDIAFHNAVLKATGNQLLLPLFEQLRPLLEFAWHHSARSLPWSAANAQQGHRAIHSAVRRGDVDGARQAMSDHLQWSALLGSADTQR
jgi:GntR family transcriptional regulator, transcriptional repressor for pyruvate dehydrogenase complex